MPNWTRALVGCALALMLLAGPRPAGAQSPQPGADSLIAARELVKAMGMSEQMAAILPLIFSQLADLMGKQDPASKPVLKDAIGFLQTKLSGRTAEVIDEIAMLYAQQISVEDLKAMATFFGTPAGQRFVKMQPQLMQQQMDIGRRWGERVAIDAQKELQEYLRQRGVPR